MSEDLVVRQCAPTLAGMKTGSLFPCPCDNPAALLEQIRQFNRRLRPKGLCLLPLHCTQSSALLYLYRPAELRRDLDGQLARQLLARAGYPPARSERCIAALIRRLRQNKDFPHEIGLFLSYPPEDVQGFIENRAGNYKCAGLWKVYGDETYALQLFAKYKKCTEIYCKHRQAGQSIEQLAVAV